MVIRLCTTFKFELTQRGLDLVVVRVNRGIHTGIHLNSFFFASFGVDPRCPIVPDSCQSPSRQLWHRKNIKICNVEILLAGNQNDT